MAAGILLALGTTKPTFATQRGAFQPVELGWNRAMTRAVVSLAGGASSGAPVARVDWDITSLLERTCQLDRLYETPGYRVGMASGYDRTLGNSGASGCIRAENGRYLMADLQGPGAVVRLWSANPTGKIWIYLDDASEPVIHTEFRRLFLGEFPPFVEPFVGVQRREDERCYHWAYVPIPFAKSCRIYLEKVCFFQATYVQFSAGTTSPRCIIATAARKAMGLCSWTANRRPAPAPAPATRTISITFTFRTRTRRAGGWARRICPPKARTCR